MYAVIETGGKQYRVEVGTELEVELLQAEPGSSVQVERVLLVADGDTAAIGRPVVANASVAAEVVRRDRGEKLISFKYRPKARRRVKKGHRQELTVLRISDIVLDGRSAAAEKAEADKARAAERAKVEETARKQAAADAELAAKLAGSQKAAANAKSGRAAEGTKVGAKGAAKDAGTRSASAKASSPSTRRRASGAPAKPPTTKESGTKSAPKTTGDKPSRRGRATGKKDS